MPPLRQSSFEGGEFSPGMWARTDYAKHPAGSKTLRNFYVGRSGKAISRPGTALVAPAKTPNHWPVRLVPFVYSLLATNQNFALEFGDTSVAGDGTGGYIRAYQNGAVVPGFTDIVTTYKAADLPYLKFAQSGDIITITHPNYAPAELTRFSNTSWTLTQPVVFAPALANTIATASAYVNTGTGGYPVSTGTPALEWSWIFTYLWRDQYGRVWESGVVPFTQSYNGSSFTALPANIQLGASTPIQLAVKITAWGGNPVLAICWYRGQNAQWNNGGLFGFIGQTTLSANTGTITTTFTDTGTSPDYSQQPPGLDNPWAITNPGGGTFTFTGRTTEQGNKTTNYPACVGFFEGRRVFCRSNYNPERVWGSTVGNYYDFSAYPVETEAGPFSYDLATRKLEEILWCVGGEQLIFGTPASIWSMQGNQGPLSFDNVEARLQTETGSTWRDPLVFDDSLLYVKSKGTGVRQLIFNLASGKFATVDVSTVSDHLFIGHQIADWAWAQDPFQLAWAIREDGKLLSFAFNHLEQLAAWSWHDTQGTFEAVCSVPEGQEDGVYFEVLRNGTRYIERLTTRVVTQASSAVCLDMAVTNTTAGVTVTGAAVTGLPYADGAAIYANVDGNVQGPLTVQGGAVTLSAAMVTTAIFGLSYLSQWRRLPLSIPGVEVRDQQKAITYIAIEVENSRGYTAGPDFSTLADEWEQRQVSDSYNPIALFTGIDRMPVESDWEYEGDFCVQAAIGMPLTITAITLRAEVGDG